MKRNVLMNSDVILQDTKVFSYGSGGDDSLNGLGGDDYLEGSAIYYDRAFLVPSSVHRRSTMLDGFIFSASASCNSVTTVGTRTPRSSIEIKVRSTSAAKAKASCDKPRSTRSSRNTAPNVLAICCREVVCMDAKHRSHVDYSPRTMVYKQEFLPANSMFYREAA